jgi:hypothetical protein
LSMGKQNSTVRQPQQHGLDHRLWGEAHFI